VRIAKVAVLNYIGLVYALIFGVTIFDEHYTAQTVLGIALVVAGVLLTLPAAAGGPLRKTQASRKSWRRLKRRCCDDASALCAARRPNVICIPPVGGKQAEPDAIGPSCAPAAGCAQLAWTACRTLHRSGGAPHCGSESGSASPK
jgi:hypothetical protein